MKCKCENSNGNTTICCCNDCGLPLQTEPWDINPPLKQQIIDLVEGEVGQVNYLIKRAEEDPTDNYSLAYGAALKHRKERFTNLLTKIGEL